MLDGSFDRAEDMNDLMENPCLLAPFPSCLPFLPLLLPVLVWFHRWPFTIGW